MIPETTVSGETLLGLLRAGPVHVVGIGGAGMSAIARLLLDAGVPVTGSDAQRSQTLDALAARGARVAVGHAAEQLGGAVLVVVSSAVHEDNPEVAAALARGVPVVHRSVALAGLMHGDRVVAVAGTHGKTTTTSMLTVAARAAGLDPSYAIGGDLVVDGVNARTGGDPVFVAEADESDRSFLAYRPEVAVITNVEADHLDHYGEAEAVHAAFARFAERVGGGGLLVVGADDRGARALVRTLSAAPEPDPPRRIVTVGESPDADVRLVIDPKADPAAEGAVAVARLVAAFREAPEPGEWRLRLQVPGRHNLADAALAWAAAVLGLGLDAAQVAAGLARFTGARRRFERIGESGGVLVVDDYAHHPTEVAATLSAARSVVGRGKLHVIFQPHLYSRTRFFADAFATALTPAATVAVLDVYAAREEPEPGVDGSLVSRGLPNGRFVPDRDEAVALVARAARKGDAVLTLGAGDVTQLAPKVLDALQERQGRARGGTAG